MDAQTIVSIITGACFIGVIAIVVQSAIEMKGSTTKNIYKDIQPHQVTMMKQVFPNFDWQRIDREIVEAKKDMVVLAEIYEPEIVDDDVVINCKPKRLDTQV